MRTFDFSPFARNAIGFEPLFDRLNDWSRDANEGYPPYDIVRKKEDQFQINIALAGFSRDEITITAEASQLTVTGKKPNRTIPNTFIKVSRELFERRSNWPTTSRSKVPTSQRLLHINLVRRVPEKLKPPDCPRQRYSTGSERRRQSRLNHQQQVGLAHCPRPFREEVMTRETV